MIGGIFGTIGKTLGIGKEKYFLELDDAAEEVASKVQKAASSAVETVKEVSSDVASAVQSEADDAKGAANKAKTKAKKTANKANKAADKAASKADKKAAEFNKKADEVIKSGDAKVAVSANEQTGKIEATAIETDKGEQPSDKTAQQVISNQPADAPAPKPARDPEEIIREALAKAEKKPSGQPANPEDAENFSTDYLMPLGNRGRRRPGPSFSGYKDMAKETNPRLRN